jgi:hypothetical protein
MLKHKVSVNGYDWEIYASKNSRTQTIDVTAAGGTSHDGMWSIAIFSDPNILLLRTPCSRATEAALQKALNQGIRNFNAKLEAGELPVRFIPPVGHVFEKNGDLYVVESSQRNSFGGFPCIQIDGAGEKYQRLAIDVKASYESHTQATPEEMEEIIQKANALADAQQRERQERQIVEASERLAQETRQNEILDSRPSWAAAAIVATYEVDACDLYSDYFATRTERRALLAWSPYTRNDMNELKQAARNMEEIADTPHWFEIRNREISFGISSTERYHGTGWRIRKVDLKEGARAGAMGENFANQEPVVPIPAPQEHPAGELLVTSNPAKGGIEVKFARKPDPDVLDSLKRNGFRWSRFGKLWYKKDTPATRNYLRTLGWTGADADQQPEHDHGGDMLDASLDQAADNWASSHL